MEKNRIRPVKAGKGLRMSYLKTERGFADAKPDRSPEEFLSVVPG